MFVIFGTATLSFRTVSGPNMKMKRIRKAVRQLAVRWRLRRRPRSSRRTTGCTTRYAVGWLQLPRALMATRHLRAAEKGRAREIQARQKRAQNRSVRAFPFPTSSAERRDVLLPKANADVMAETLLTPRLLICSPRKMEGGIAQKKALSVSLSEHPLCLAAFATLGAAFSLL